MSLHPITEIILGFLANEAEPSQGTAGDIASARQAISQVSESVAAQKTLSPDRAMIQNRETVGQHIEETFLEVIRPLTPQLREKMIQETARGLRELYVDKVKGEEMAKAILNKLQQGGYDAFGRQFPLIKQLQADLQTICSDLHLQVRSSLYPIPLDDPDRNLQDLKIEDLTPSQLLEFKKNLEQEKEAMREINFGVHSARMLQDTIGYLKITQFARPDFEETFQKIDQAMTSVKDAKALIIDLTGNQGGCPDTVARLASYFYDNKTLVNRLYQRTTNTVTEFYAEPDKVSFRFGQAKPICILVDDQTFSAAEEFAYDLQSNGRGIVVGQTTQGGAHPIRNFVIDDHFYVSIPNQKAINPITNTNWEGIGVIPDKVLPQSEDPLKTAISILSSPSK